MAEAAHSRSGGRQSWKQAPRTTAAGGSALAFWRTIFTVLFLVLVGLFVWLLALSWSLGFKTHLVIVRE